jgi:tRNA-uridine 2-sulfurtransferase
MGRMSTGAENGGGGVERGVDSSVAAWKLKQDGWRVVGLTMSIWDGSVPIPDAGLSGCFGPGEARDLEAAKESRTASGSSTG